MTWRWKLQTGASLDLSPSMHWPEPLTEQAIENDRGPVPVTVEYRIDPADREPFLDTLARLEHGRRRDGAYAWGVFEDAAQEGRIIETFLIEAGWSICASMSASPRPIALSRRRYAASTDPAIQRWRISSPPMRDR